MGTRRYDGGPPGWEWLTPRYRQVIDLLTDGMHNRQIAERLGISIVTVNKHIIAMTQRSRTDRYTLVSDWKCHRCLMRQAHEKGEKR